MALRFLLYFLFWEFAETVQVERLQSTFIHNLTSRNSSLDPNKLYSSIKSIENTTSAWPSSNVLKRTVPLCNPTKLRSAKEISAEKFRTLADKFGLAKTPQQRWASQEAYAELSKEIQLLRPSRTAGFKVPAIKGATAKAGIAMAIVGLPLWGLAIRETFASESSTGFDKAAVLTAAVPFVGCYVSDMNKLDHAYRDGFPTQDAVDVALSVVDSLSCYVVNALYFTPLLPYALAYSAARMAVDAYVTYALPRNPTVKPEDVADIRRDGWRKVLEGVEETVMSRNWTDNVEAMHRRGRYGPLTVAALAAGNFEAQVQKLVRNASEDEEWEIQVRVDGEDFSMSRELCAALKRQRDKLRHAITRFVATRLHNAASQYEDELYEELRMKWQWPWEDGKQTPALDRLRQLQATQPLIRTRSTLLLHQRIEEWLDDSLGRKQDPVSPCEDVHLPNLYAPNEACKDPCRSAARRWWNHASELGWGLTPEGHGIWGCVVYRDGRREGAESPDCCPYAAFDLEGFGLSRKNGSSGIFLGKRCVEFGREKSSLSAIYQFMDPSSSTTASTAVETPAAVETPTVKLTEDPACSQPCREPHEGTRFEEIHSEGVGIYGCQVRNSAGMTLWQGAPRCCRYRELTLRDVDIGIYQGLVSTAKVQQANSSVGQLEGVRVCWDGLLGRDDGCFTEEQAPPSADLDFTTSDRDLADVASQVRSFRCKGRDSHNRTWRPWYYGKDVVDELDDCFQALTNSSLAFEPRCERLVGSMVFCERSSDKGVCYYARVTPPWLDGRQESCKNRLPLFKTTENCVGTRRWCESAAEEKSLLWQSGMSVEECLSRHHGRDGIQWPKAE
ncbi:putative heat-labile enterotoxin [Ophiocordyceps camponoti-saundersi (nom. inval.)]|nr:putative heat-labile enterotoxin [Ophiocordyceps camponoti-saundersi (nom. inval.)]